MITLVLGGTRSGKSAFAESLAAATGQPVVYVATAFVDPNDPAHVERVRAHQSRRSTDWHTIECQQPHDLVAALKATTSPVLVDSLGTWVTQHADLDVDATDLLDALQERPYPTIFVSEEVGLAVHPPTELGRRYIDALGTLNQQVSAVASRAFLVVAGRPLVLPAPAQQAPPGAAP